MMEDTFKSVGLYIQIMDFFLVKRGEAKNRLPEDLFIHITEYALPSSVERWFYSSVDRNKLLETGYGNVPGIN
jgi:hypothetical protein